MTVSREHINLVKIQKDLHTEVSSLLRSHVQLSHFHEQPSKMLPQPKNHNGVTKVKFLVYVY